MHELSVPYHLGRASDKSEILSVVNECSMLSLFFTFLFGLTRAFRREHCTTETKNGLQKNLSRACKQLRLVKCHASRIRLCIQQSVIIKGVDSGPPGLGFRSRFYRS